MIKNKYVILSGLFSLLIISLAILGGVLNYSPVPYWDMWGGVLKFNFDIDNGNYSTWWSQHNEHRIVIARVLFWLDYNFFSGLSIFLIVLNYILVSLFVFMFWLFVRNINEYRQLSQQEIVFGILLSSWLFLWVQKENLVWAFQSQFFLAQLLPLCSLFCLARSSQTKNSSDFMVACLLGCLSVGTMANGVLVLPLMLCYSLVLKLNTKRISFLLLLSLAAIFLYFFDYHSVEGHGSLSSSLQNNSIGLIHYSFIYLGSPFFYFFKKFYFAKDAALFFGLLLFCASIWIACIELQKKNKSPFVIALLFFILYIGVTAFGTASGRYIFGLDQAVSSRYTTPAIAAYAALLVILNAKVSWSQASSLVKNTILILIVTLGVLILKQQVKAGKFSATDMLFEREVAALALGLGIQDDFYINKIYPDAESAMSLAKIAIQNKYTIFGKYPLSNVGQEFRGLYAFALPSECKGVIDKIERLESTDKYVRVHGRFLNQETEDSSFIRIADAKRTQVGFAVLSSNNKGYFFGARTFKADNEFVGYISSPLEKTDVFVINESKSCYFKANVSYLEFSQRQIV